MFKVGEVVFCAMRGIGVVEAIEMREVLNESREYIIIQMKSPQLVMMIPTDRVDASGFRKISDKDAVDAVENILIQKNIEVDYSMDNKKRTKYNQEKLTSGSFLSCSEVYRDLICMEKSKPLNNVEKTLLMQARKFLVDEIATIKNISTQEADCRIQELINQ